MYGKETLNERKDFNREKGEDFERGEGNDTRNAPKVHAVKKEKTHNKGARER